MRSTTIPARLRRFADRLSSAGRVRRTWALLLLTAGFGALFAGCAGTGPVREGARPPEAGVINPLRLDRSVVALVLGAGGARGFAHVGVIKALEGAGIVPDIVVGSSSGSIVAALYAAGHGGARLEEMALALEDAEVIDYTLAGNGWVRGEALRDYVNRSVGHRGIEALARPFAVVATEAQSGAMTVFTSGETGLAVRASSTVPKLFVPPVINGKEYLDGGLSSRVPSTVARRMGADVVIAVDISRGRGVTEADQQATDVVIRPVVPRTRMLDFTQKRASIAAGEAAALDVIADVHRLIELSRVRKAAIAAARR